MLNFKGKMYKLCEKKDMDRQAKQPKKSKPVEVDRKIRSDKGGTHKMPSGKVMTGKTHTKDSKPVKKQSPPKAKPKSKPKPVKKQSAPKKVVKAKPKKAKKQMKVEGFPAFKGDEPRAKEEKRRENKLY